MNKTLVLNYIHEKQHLDIIGVIFKKKRKSRKGG